LSTYRLDVVWEELNRYAWIFIIAADNISKSPKVSSRIFTAWDLENTSRLSMYISAKISNTVYIRVVYFSPVWFQHWIHNIHIDLLGIGIYIFNICIAHAKDIPRSINVKRMWETIRVTVLGHILKWESRKVFVVEICNLFTLLFHLLVLFSHMGTHCFPSFQVSFFFLCIWSTDLKSFAL